MPLPLTQAAFVAGTLIVLLAGSLSAKAPTVRLTIAGADLPAPIETSDPAALANIWAGTFIGDPCQAPDTSLPRYRVMFHVRWADTPFCMSATLGRTPDLSICRGVERRARRSRGRLCAVVPIRALSARS